MNMLNRMTFKRIENGFIIRYHITKNVGADPATGIKETGETHELFMPTKDSLKATASHLILQFITEEE